MRYPFSPARTCLARRPIPSEIRPRSPRLPASRALASVFPDRSSQQTERTTPGASGMTIWYRTPRATAAAAPPVVRSAMSPGTGPDPGASMPMASHAVSPAASEKKETVRGSRSIRTTAQNRAMPGTATTVRLRRWGKALTSLSRKGDRRICVSFARNCPELPADAPSGNQATAPE